MNTIKFKAYDKRVKTIRLLREIGSFAYLVTCSTEGYISVWDIEDLLGKLPTLDHKMLEIEGNFDSLYHFEIQSRLICLDAKIQMPKVSQITKKQKKSIQTRIKSGLRLRLNSGLAKLKMFNFYKGMEL